MQAKSIFPVYHPELLLFHSIRFKLLSVRLVILAWLVGSLSGCSKDSSDDLHQQLQSRSQTDVWVVLNYWATWCAPCLKEIPELNKLDAREGIEVHAINFDDADYMTQTQAEDQARAAGIRYAVMIGRPHQTFGFAKPRGLPTSVVISPEGEVREVILGDQTEASLLKIIATASAQVEMPAPTIENGKG